ncbi:hypothetical protein PIB30_056940 [Stylosanthes scabra]|uniref:Uncharacterized protein n=1 Tax=Stylosanthes scabra TaxID=79078 RepID=A0ABU6UL43_9FABA|nr:hypothetical protein [Stylosanthes scabra]
MFRSHLQPWSQKRTDPMIGTGYKIEGTRGRMELKAQTVQSHQGRTTLIQLKSQIGSCFYFPSLQIRCYRDLESTQASIFFHSPAQDYTILARDWYTRGHHTKGALIQGLRLGIFHA